MSSTATLEPGAAAPPELSRRQTNVVFVTIVLGMLLAALDQTIVSTALPTIVADLGGAGHMAWVVTAYLLAETVATVLAGKFGDLFGRKRVFQVSAVVFIAGSALAGGASALILGLEWGGNEYAWGSPVIVGLFAGAAVLLAAFVLVELRAREPMLPMGLFRNPVFVVCAVLSFIVGFALLGALTYLPTYLQFVDGVSATASGLRTTPMVLGLLATSMLSGTIVGRTGRYKVFPIAGTAIMAVGLYLMSTMDTGTGIWLESLYMLVLGLGIGLAMQVLTIVVQNTVPYAQLGTATSGVTFFRTLGSSFGAAVFGTLYSSQLEPNLGEALARAPGVSPEVAQNPAALAALPAQLAAPIVEAYADTIGFVFRWVVPVALAGFVIAWFLKQVPLRDTARAGATDLGEGFGAPEAPDRVAQLERAVAAVMRRAQRDPDFGQEIFANAGAALSRGQAWTLHQVYLRERAEVPATVTAVARAHHLPPDVLEPAFAGVIAAGYATRAGDQVDLTPNGRAQLGLLHSAWRRWLDTQLDDWSVTDPADRAHLDQALDNIARRLVVTERESVHA